MNLSSCCGQPIEKVLNVYRCSNCKGYQSPKIEPKRTLRDILLDIGDWFYWEEPDKEAYLKKFEPMIESYCNERINNADRSTI